MKLFMLSIFKVEEGDSYDSHQNRKAQISFCNEIWIDLNYTILRFTWDFKEMLTGMKIGTV